MMTSLDDADQVAGISGKSIQNARALEERSDSAGFGTNNEARASPVVPPPTTM